MLVFFLSIGQYDSICYINSLKIHIEIVFNNLVILFSFVFMSIKNSELTVFSASNLEYNDYNVRSKYIMLH